MTPWLFVSPVLWLMLLLEARRERFRQAGKTLLLGTYPLALGFYLVQFRFGLVLGVAIAVLAGWAIERAWCAYRERRAYLVALPVFAFALFTLVLAAWALKPPALRDVRRVKDPTVRTYWWIRDHTPPTRGYDDPRVRPEYAVLTDWEQGHYLTYFARRANIANPLAWFAPPANITNPFAQAPAHSRGYVRAAEILLDTDARDAVARCESLGIRYLVLHNSPKEVGSIAAGVQEQHDAGATSPNPLRNYMQTLHARLGLFDGAASPSRAQTVAPIADFRLVYESPEPGEAPVRARGWPPMAARLTKVFERVPGALLAGDCVQTRPVEAKVEVRTNAERRFPFTTVAPCGADGRFSLRLPYAPSTPGETGAAGPYRVRSGARRATVHVTESDVLEGKRIAIDAWSDSAREKDRGVAGGERTR